MICTLLFVGLDNFVLVYFKFNLILNTVYFLQVSKWSYPSSYKNAEDPFKFATSALDLHWASYWRDLLAYHWDGK